jgi:hypothetical protein
LATVCASAGKPDICDPLILMLPETVLPGPPRPGLALPLTQLLVNVRWPVLFDARLRRRERRMQRRCSSAPPLPDAPLLPFEPPLDDTPPELPLEGAPLPPEEPELELAPASDMPGFCALVPQATAHAMNVVKWPPELFIRLLGDPEPTRPRFGLDFAMARCECRRLPLSVADVFCTDHENHFFGHVGRVVRDAF